MNANNDEVIDDMVDNPKSTLFKMAIPSFFSLACLFLNTFLDSFWVSGLGNIEVTAIGLTSPLFYILTTFGIAIGTSVNVLLSRSMSAKDVEKSNDITKNITLIIIIFSILIPLIVLPLLGIILDLMGAGVTYNACMDYVFILILCIGIFLVSDISPFFLRLQGHIRIPVYITISTSILNMILNPIFIYVFKLGVRGASLATVLSALVSTLLLLIFIYFKRSNYICIRNFRFETHDFKIIKDILRFSVPIILQSILSLIFAIILNKFLFYEGLVSITAYSFSNRLLAFLTIPYTAFSSAMISVIGFLVGSRQYDEMKPNFRYALFVNLIFTFVPAVLLFIGSDFLSVTLYQTKDMVVISQISLSIKYLSIYYFFQSACIMITSMFISIDEPNKSFRLILAGVIVEVVVLFVMEYQLHIADSVYYVLIVGAILQVLVFNFLFARDLKKFLKSKKESISKVD